MLTANVAMKQLLHYGLFTVCHAAVTNVDLSSGVQPPLWPTTYEVQFTQTLPQTRKDVADITYTTRAWVDCELGMSLTITDDVEKTYTLLDYQGQGGIQFVVAPAKDQWRCWADVYGDNSVVQEVKQLLQSGSIADTHAHVAAEAAPLLSEEGSTHRPKLPSLLPDLSAGGWQLNQTKGNWKGQTAQQWVWEVDRDVGYGHYEGTYTFYVRTADSRPLSLVMWGTNLLEEAHYDNYVIEYTHWKPNHVDVSQFAVPDVCKGVHPEPDSIGSRVPMSFRMLGRFLPPAHADFLDAYDGFQHATGRVHHSTAQYLARRVLFHHSRQVVQACNARGAGHRCSLNRMADWTSQERSSYFRGSGTRISDDSIAKRVQLSKTGTIEKGFSRSSSALPDALDLRLSPLASAVKDQALCGGCWAFSAVGAIEAAYANATGRPASFSEQFLLDCSWEQSKEGRNEGCMGGYQDMGLDYLLSLGYIPFEASYPYKGHNQFCPTDAERKSLPGIAFRGQWFSVEGGEEAVRRALLEVGPLAVSVDASADEWVFYKAGVFDSPSCHTKAAELDHGVTLLGYGTDADSGKKYWIIKNEWGSWWGQQGYIYVSRHPDDCGIVAQPLYVRMELVQELTSIT